MISQLYSLDHVHILIYILMTFMVSSWILMNQNSQEAGHVYRYVILITRCTVAMNYVLSLIHYWWNELLSTCAKWVDFDTGFRPAFSHGFDLK